MLGQQKVQDLNYAYTLQGWLKLINGVQPGYNDIALDGYVDGSGNGYGFDTKAAKDAYALTLYYFRNDYVANYNWTTFYVSPASNLDTLYRSLYNGNITATSLYIPKLAAPIALASTLTPVMFYNYKYDQLNRIKAMDLHLAYNNTGQSWDFLKTNTRSEYRERISYDGNGNILKYFRNGTTAGGKKLAMDDLTYTYYTGTNRLRQVRDTVNAANYTEDIDNQTITNNYVYDEIGNMIKDTSENINTVRWNVYGKIESISKYNDSIKINYTYDASGNRISKDFILKLGGGVKDTTTTWYARDAQGNVMSVYSLKTDTVRQDELHLYGSSRLGIIKPERILKLNGQLVDSLYGDTTGTITLLGTFKGDVFTRGKKFFELTNHLGNVLVTVSDRKQQVPKTGDTLLKYYEPDVVTANDYYPFGMGMVGRKYSAGNGYRYGFNGKENDNEVKGEGNQQDYGMRVYDPRLGKFLSVDPLSGDYPELTPYQFASNTPIWAIDLDGGEALALTPEGGGSQTGTTAIGNSIKTWWNAPTTNPWAKDLERKLGVPINTNGELFLASFYNSSEHVASNSASTGGINGGKRYSVVSKGQEKATSSNVVTIQAPKVSSTPQTGTTKIVQPNTKSVSAKPSSFIRTETPSGNQSARSVGANIKLINEGKRLAPIEVADINGKLYIINGHHRVQAALRTNTELDYKVLTKNEWKAYGYNSEAEIVQAGAEASATRVNLNNRIIQSAAGTSNK